MLINTLRFSIFQTSSYNFIGTSTTKEMAAGVVMGAKVCPKNSAKHYADLNMLTHTPQFQSSSLIALGM